jgi:hypothetical protein
LCRVRAALGLKPLAASTRTADARREADAAAAVEAERARAREELADAAAGRAQLGEDGDLAKQVQHLAAAGGAAGAAAGADATGGVWMASIVASSTSAVANR